MEMRSHRPNGKIHDLRDGLIALSLSRICGALFWLPTVTLIAVYLFRRLQLEERLRAIEKGLETTFDPEANAVTTRRTGIVLIATGIGFAAAVGIVTLVSRDRSGRASSMHAIGSRRVRRLARR
jgi:hypothetical protein